MAEAAVRVKIKIFHTMLRARLGTGMGLEDEVIFQLSRTWSCLLSRDFFSLHITYISANFLDAHTFVGSKNKH